MTNLTAGCIAKLDRALELLNLLEVEAASYFEEHPIRLEVQHRNEGLDCSLVAFGPDAPPTRFAVIAGEIVHHLRSSLDHLICALVLKNGNTPGKFNQFPICVNQKAFKEACNRRQLDGLSPTAKAIVASDQPYTSQTPEDTILQVVSELDNADKHRLLVVVATVADVSESIVIGEDPIIAALPERLGKKPNIVGFGQFGMQRLRGDGVPIFTVKLQEPAPEMTLQSAPVAALAFELSGGIKLAPLIDTLRLMVNGVGGTVNLFKEEFV